MTNGNKIGTLKQLAHLTIAKSSRQIIKRESGVLKDRDPENLHKMRVGMRRLRSAISGFASAVDLPEVICDKNLAKIGHSLGKLRDLDVLLEVLSNSYRAQLSSKEQQSLARVIQSLEKNRKAELGKVRKTLNSKLYGHFKQELNNWLEQPKYQRAGNLAVEYALPDLLLPQVAQFLLHSGWFVGVEVKSGEIEFADTLNMEAIQQLLTREDTFLHDLRKSAKKTRYSLELFSQFYGDTYHHYLKQIEKVQEILGQIQDTHVLRKVLEKMLRSPISHQMPELANLLLKIRYQKWLEWQNIQQEFLQQETRQEFRLAIQGEIKS